MSLSEAIPALQVFPDLRIDFSRRRPSSREAAALAAMLQELLGTGTPLREPLRGDYLILYVRQGDDRFLLAIKHHQQLSFDFPEPWEG